MVFVHQMISKSKTIQKVYIIWFIQNCNRSSRNLEFHGNQFSLKWRKLIFIVYSHDESSSLSCCLHHPYCHVNIFFLKNNKILVFHGNLVTSQICSLSKLLAKYFQNNIGFHMSNSSNEVWGTKSEIVKRNCSGHFLTTMQRTTAILSLTFTNKRFFHPANMVNITPLTEITVLYIELLRV